MKLKHDYPGYKAAVRVLAHKSEHTHEDVIDAVAAVLSVIEHERGQDPAENRLPALMRQTKKERKMDEIATKRGVYRCEQRDDIHVVAFYPADGGARKEKLQTWHYHDLQLTTYGDRKNAVQAAYYSSRSGDDIVVIDFGDDPE